jgi:hypothetical protein
MIEVHQDMDALTEVTNEQGQSQSSMTESGESVARPGFGKSAYKRSTYMIKSSRRIHKVAAKERKMVPTKGEVKVARCEIDNHADTCCLGSKFIPLYFTGDECEVQPFTDSYDPIQSVLICSAVTAYNEEETGLAYLLEFNECLWMPDQPEHSLINPNQIRSFGIPFSDDPYDKNRPLGFVDPNTGHHIPFKVKVSTCLYSPGLPQKKKYQNVVDVSR